MNEDDDFGFSFIDQEEFKSIDKAALIKAKIMPLLNNLMKNPEKDTIVWPDRVKRIQKFIKELDEIMSS